MNINLLRKYKKDNNLSYSQIAEQSGLNQPTVWRTLNEKSVPTIDTLQKLVSITGGKITINDII